MKHVVGFRCASPRDSPLDLREITFRPARSCDTPRYQELMRQHHYLGALPKVSETLEIAYGFTSRRPEHADPRRVL